MNADAWKKRLLLHLPYGVIGLAAAKLSEAWRLSAGTDFSAKFLHLRDGVAMAFRNGLSGFVPLDLLIGFLCGCALCLLVHAKRRNAKKYRHGEEYGAARWGKPSDIAPFMDADPWNNIILTQTERLTMSSRPANPKNARNKNVLVIGGSGSGKTRFFIKPNIMQCTKTKGCSLVITDPKGTLITECGKMLAAAGYDVRVFNVISFQKSMHYNPFAYIRSEKDILKLVTALIANTKGEGKGGDDFWIKAETLLYMALIGYIHYELPPAAQNFTTLIVPVARVKMTGNTDLEIVTAFDAELRGLCNYYSLASNYRSLNFFSYLMEYSCLKTLAWKHRCNHRWTCLL